MGSGGEGLLWMERQKQEDISSRPFLEALENTRLSTAQIYSTLLHLRAGEQPAQENWFSFPLFFCASASKAHFDPSLSSLLLQ
jgi:hypothetical protein